MIGANSLSKSAAPVPKSKKRIVSLEDASEGSLAVIDGPSDSDSSVAAEIPFLAILPEEDEALITKPILKRTMVRASSMASIKASIKKKVPRRVASGVRYVTRSKFPKYIKVALTGLLVTFIAHMICIAIGMYQLAHINPALVKITMLHLHDMDSPVAKVSAKANIPMPWMAQFFKINIVKPKIEVLDEGKKLLTVDFPSVRVGRKMSAVDLDCVEFRATTHGSKSLFAILMQHLQPLHLIKGRKVNKLKLKMSCRLQTSSFWYPLDVGADFDHELDLVKMKEELLKEKPDEEKELPILRSIRIDPGKNKSDLNIVASLQLPPRSLTAFMKVDVPHLVGSLWFLPDSNSESEPIFLGKACIVKGQLSGALLSLKDQVRLEAVIDKAGSKGMKKVLSLLWDRDRNLNFRFAVNPSQSSFISQIMSLDVSFNLDHLIKEIKSKGDPSLPKGALASVLSRDKGTDVVRMMKSVKKDIHKYGRDSNSSVLGGGPVVSIKLEKVHAEVDTIKFNLTVVLKRDILSHMCKFDFRLLEGSVPSVSIAVLAEVAGKSSVKSRKLAKVKMSSQKFKPGNADVRMDVTIEIRTDTMKQVAFGPGTKNIIIKGGDSGLVSIFLESFETCLQIGTGSEPRVFLTRRKGSMDYSHSRKKLLHKAQKIFFLQDGYVRKRIHRLQTSIETTEDEINIATGLVFSKKPSLKEWPYARIEWENFNLSLRPAFSKRKHNRLFRSTTIAQIGLPAGGLSLTLCPSNPLNLVFNGLFKLTISIKESRYFSRASLIDTVRVLFKDYKPDLVRSISVGLIKSEKAHKKRRQFKTEPLVKVSYEVALAKAKLMIKKRDSGKMESIKRFFRNDDQMQVAVAGVNNARVNLLVPIPKTARLNIPKGFRPNSLLVTFSLPPVRSLICNVNSGVQRNHCPASVGVDPVQVSLFLSHNRPVVIETDHPAYSYKKVEGLNKFILAFAEIHSFTQIFGFAESALIKGNDEELRVTFGQRVDGKQSELPWRRASMLDKLFSSLGSLVSVPLRKPSTSGLHLFSSDRLLKYDRSKTLRFAAKIESPTPLKLSFDTQISLPKGSVLSDTQRKEYFTDDDASKLFVIKWGTLRLKFLCAALGTFELKVQKGLFGLHLHRILKQKKNPLDSLIATMSKIFRLTIETEVFPTFTDFSSMHIRDFFLTIMYYLDYGVGHVFPKLRKCKFKRGCRKLTRSSTFFKARIDKIMDKSVSMEVEHDTIRNILGGHTENRLLFVRRGLQMLRLLWAKHGAMMIERLREHQDFDMEEFGKHFKATLSFARHPEVTQYAALPGILPKLSDPKGLGKLDQERLQVGTLHVTIQRVFRAISTKLHQQIPWLYRLFDIPRAPMMLSYRLWAPSLSLSLGINRVDLVEVETESLSLWDRINVANGLNSKRGETLSVMAQFPRTIGELPSFFAPFGIDSHGQISVDPLPRVRKGQIRHRCSNSPLNLSVGTNRLKRKPNLLSILIASLPDIPIFPVTDHVDPFEFALKLVDSDQDWLKMELGGLRLFNPLPGVSLDMGEMTAVVMYRGFPFIKMIFGERYFAPGGNAIDGIEMVFSKSAFDHPAMGTREEAQVRDALNSLASLGAAGRPLDLMMLLSFGDDMKLKIPLRVPEREIPQMKELMALAPAPSEEMKEFVLDMAADIGADMTRDAMASADGLWKSFVGKLFWYKPEEILPPQQFAPSKPRQIMDFNISYNLPWETSVLGYHVTLTLDLPSSECPPVVPVPQVASKFLGVSKESRRHTFRHDAADPENLDTCPAVLSLMPGERAEVEKGLVGTGDMPSARFAMQVASNAWRRMSFCASVAVEDVTVRMTRLDGDSTPFVLSTRIKGLPEIPVSYYPELRPCRPDKLNCQATYAKPVIEKMPYRSDDMTSVPNTGNLSISFKHDIFSTARVSIRYHHDSYLNSIGFGWCGADGQALVRVMIDVRTGEALLLLGPGGEETLKSVPAGAYPIIPINAPDSTLLTLEVKPYERQLILSIGDDRPEATWSSVAFESFYLPDYFPQDHPGTGVKLNFIASTRHFTRVTGWKVEPVWPDFTKSSLFHWRQESFRVFQTGLVALQLKDGCGRPIGRATGTDGQGIEAVLVRISEDWDYSPWPAKHNTCVYESLALAGPTYASLDDGLHPDKKIKAKLVKFDPLDGVYLLQFTCVVPGRYRVFLKYTGQPADSEAYRRETAQNWYLLHHHHIFINQ